MTVDQMRKAIAEIYPGFTWKDKVAHMSDDQVIAIWCTFRERSVFDKPSACKTHDGRRVKQLSVFDILRNERSE